MGEVSWGQIPPETICHGTLCEINSNANIERDVSEEAVEGSVASNALLLGYGTQVVFSWEGSNQRWEKGKSAASTGLGSSTCFVPG